MTLAMLEDVVAFGHDPASLDVIARPTVALAIWWRSLPDELRVGLAALDLDTVDDVSVDIEADALLDATLRVNGASCSQSIRSVVATACRKGLSCCRFDPPIMNTLEI